MQPERRQVGLVEELVREHAPFVGRALRYLGVPEADVPDATQEVFLVAHRRRDDFDGQSPRAWLKAIAVHVARNARRSLRRRREAGADALPEGSVPPAQEAAAERRSRRGRALALLEALPKAQREVFVLHDVEQHTMKEVSHMLGIPLQTGYSRLRLARARLQRTLTDEEQA
ncbi:MAG: sigma-70 family RNA polymerase sigma factor [Myxococcota bacterium]